MTETLVIYHGGCRDGFCAAWVVNKYLFNHLKFEDLDVKYHPGFYGQKPPDCTDKNVIIVDFAYDVEAMDKIANECKSLIWLDHHKTAEPIALLFRDRLIPFNSWLDKVKFDFDISRSGAGIAWDFYFHNELRPWLVDYVEDRDLWAKKLENSDWVNSYIACLAFDFKVWDLIAANMTLTQAMHNGVIATAKTEQYVREVCKNVYFADINGTNDRDKFGHVLAFDIRQLFLNIPIVNICQVDCSEVMENLLKLYPESPFSLYWFKRADGMYQYGMRSIGDFDVSKVAKLFDGGGHKNAAGFQLNYLLEELK